MASFVYSVDEQEKVFSGFWDKFSTQIAGGQGAVDFPTGNDLLPHHITTITRLPQNLASGLYEKLGGICPEEYHYPSTDIHMTFINLDKLLNYREDIDWNGLANAISSAIEGLPELHFRLKGIGVFPTTIFAQAYDESGVLEQYRSAIAEAVTNHQSLNISPDEIKALVPGIIFANVIRFKQKPQPEIIQAIGNLRNLDIGAFKPTKLELVATNKLLSLEHTVVHANIQLN